MLGSCPKRGGTDGVRGGGTSERFIFYLQKTRGIGKRSSVFDGERLRFSI